MCRLDPVFINNHSRKDVVAWDAGKLFKHVNIHMALYSRLWLTAFVVCVESTLKSFYTKPLFPP